MLEARGCTVQRVNELGEQTIAKESKLRARIAVERDYRTAVLNAQPISAERREAIASKYQPTPFESADAERYDAAVTVGLTPDDLDDEALALYAHGALRGWIRRFETMRAAPGDLLQHDLSDRATAHLTRRGHALARRSAYRALFESVGLNPDDGSGSVTGSAIRAAFDRLAKSDHRAVLEHSETARFDRSPAYPVRWLGDALARFGLALEEHGGHADERRYRIAMDRSVRSDETISAAGWHALEAIGQMRKERINIIESMCPIEIEIDVDAIIASAAMRTAA